MGKVEDRYRDVERLAKSARLPTYMWDTVEGLAALARFMDLARDPLQAKIDALMMEYCPEEMTPEQLAVWGRHQRPLNVRVKFVKYDEASKHERFDLFIDEAFLGRFGPEVTPLANALTKILERSKPTHRHADGGLYRFIREGRCLRIGTAWVEAVVYEDVKDGALYVTSPARWVERFIAL